MVPCSYRATAREEKILTDEQLSAVSSFLSIHKVSETLEKKLSYARTFSYEAAIEEIFLKKFEVPSDLWRSLQVSERSYESMPSELPSLLHTVYPYPLLSIVLLL